MRHCVGCFQHLETSLYSEVFSKACARAESRSGFDLHSLTGLQKDSEKELVLDTSQCSVKVHRTKTFLIGAKVLFYPVSPLTLCEAICVSCHLNLSQRPSAKECKVIVQQKFI